MAEAVELHDISRAEWAAWDAIGRYPNRRRTRCATPMPLSHKEIAAILTEATRDLRSRGAEIVDPIVVPGLVELLNQSGNGTAETEEAVNSYLAQYPQAPAHTLQEIVDSPLLLAARHEDLARRLGHSTDELSYLKEQQARETLRTDRPQSNGRQSPRRICPGRRLRAGTCAHSRGLTTPGSIRRFAASPRLPGAWRARRIRNHGLPIGIEFPRPTVFGNGRCSEVRPMTMSAHNSASTSARYCSSPLRRTITSERAHQGRQFASR